MQAGNRTSCLEARIIGIAFFGASVERRAIVRIQLTLQCKAFGQVRIGNEQAAKSNGIRQMVSNGPLGRFRRVATRRYQDALKGLAEDIRSSRCVAINGRIRSSITHSRLYQMHVGDTASRKLLQNIAEESNRIRVTHIGKRSVRRKADAHAVPAPNLDHGVYNFQQQTRAVLNGPSIDVGAVVGFVFQELIEKITVCAVYLYPVEPARFRIFRATAILGDDAGDLIQPERARSFKGYLPEIGGERPRPVRRGDGGRSHRKTVFGVKRAVGNATYVPKLEEDAGIFRVNGAGRNFPACDLFLRMNSRRCGISFTQQRDLCCFGDEKPARRRTLSIISGIEFVGDITRLSRAHAGKRRQNDAMRKFQVTHGQRGKKMRKSTHPSMDAGTLRSVALRYASAPKGILDGADPGKHETFRLNG